MNWYYLEKEFYDYAENIEGVNIHYLWTPLESVADWEHQRVTRFMPLVHSSLPKLDGGSDSLASKTPSPPVMRLRKKILKLPLCILDPQNGASTDRYLLHHYFEIFQDGHRLYSPLYTEAISTGAGIQPHLLHSEAEEKTSSAPLPWPQASVKQSKE